MIALVVLSAVFLFLFNLGTKINKAEGFGSFLNVTVMFGAAGIISWIVCLFSGNAITADMLPFAAAFAVMVTVSMISSYVAYEKGSVAGTALFSNAGLIVVIVFSVLFFKEELNALKIIGITGVLTALTFLSLPEDRSGGSKANVVWLALCILILLNNSGISIVGKIRQKNVGGQDPFGYMALCYTLAFALSAVTYFVANVKRKSLKKDAVLLRSCVPSLIFQIVGSAGSNLLVTYLSAIVDASILYPISMGGGLVLTILAGFIVFKEKKTILRISGVTIGIVSMILLSI